MNGGEHPDHEAASPAVDGASDAVAEEADEPIPATQDDPRVLGHPHEADEPLDGALHETVDDEDHDSEDHDGEDHDSEDHDADQLPPIERDPSPPATTSSKRWLWLLVPLALVAGLAASAYFFLWKYEPTALRHVPAGSQFVIRGDANQLLLFKPVREHLGPVLLDGKGNLDTDRRVTRIREETGINVATDLRELVIASVDGVAWVALIGGKLRKGRFVEGMKRVLDEEGSSGWRLDGDLLFHASGIVIAQADDGTLILATHRPIADAALVESDADVEPPVPTEGALSFRITRGALKRMIEPIPAAIPVGPLAQIDELSGHLTLSDDPRLVITASPHAPATAATLATGIDGMFSKLGLALLLVPGDLYGAKKAISNASVSVAGDDVRIDAPWPYAPLDQAVSLLATALERHRASNPTKDTEP